MEIDGLEMQEIDNIFNDAYKKTNTLREAWRYAMMRYAEIYHDREVKKLNEPAVSNSHCLVVTCLPCKTPFIWKEAPEGCCECGMLDWLCFNTEQEANEAFKKQYPEQFDGDGKYIGTQHR